MRLGVLVVTPATFRNPYNFEDVRAFLDCGAASERRLHARPPRPVSRARRRAPCLSAALQKWSSPAAATNAEAAGTSPHC